MIHLMCAEIVAVIRIYLYGTLSSATQNERNNQVKDSSKCCMQSDGRPDNWPDISSQAGLSAPTSKKTKDQGGVQSDRGPDIWPDYSS